MGAACVRDWVFELAFEPKPELLPAASRGGLLGVPLHTTPPPFQALQSAEDHHLEACCSAKVQPGKAFPTGLGVSMCCIHKGYPAVSTGKEEATRSAPTLSMLVPSTTDLQLAT